jgi:hypothetical protein
MKAYNYTSHMRIINGKGDLSNMMKQKRRPGYNKFREKQI